MVFSSVSAQGDWCKVCRCISSLYINFLFCLLAGALAAVRIFMERHFRLFYRKRAAGVWRIFPLRRIAKVLYYDFFRFANDLPLFCKGKFSEGLPWFLGGMRTALAATDKRRKGKTPSLFQGISRALRRFGSPGAGQKGGASIFPQKKQKKIKFFLKKIDFFFGIYYTLKRTAKFAAKFVADMAQVVERVLGKDEVPGSSPGISSSKKRICIFLQVRFFVSRKPPGYEAHPKVRRLWRRISLPGGFLIRTCGSLQAPFVAQCQGSLDVQGGENERSRNLPQKNLKSIFAGKSGKTSPLRRGERREKRDCLSRPGRKPHSLSQGRAGDPLPAISFRKPPRCRAVPQDRYPKPRKGWQTYPARASCPP